MALRLRLPRHTALLAEEATKNLHPRAVTGVEVLARKFCMACHALDCQGQGSHRGLECAGPAGQ